MMLWKHIFLVFSSKKCANSQSLFGNFIYYRKNRFELISCKSESLAFIKLMTAVKKMKCDNIIPGEKFFRAFIF